MGLFLQGCKMTEVILDSSIVSDKQWLKSNYLSKCANDFQKTILSKSIQVRK